MIIGRYEFQISLLGNRCNLLNFNMIATPSKMNQTRAPSGYKLGWYIYLAHWLSLTTEFLILLLCFVLTNVQHFFLSMWRSLHFGKMSSACAALSTAEYVESQDGRVSRSEDKSFGRVRRNRSSLSISFLFLMLFLPEE